MEWAENRGQVVGVTPRLRQTAIGTPAGPLSPLQICYTHSQIHEAALFMSLAMGNITWFLPKWQEDSPEAKNELLILLSRPTRGRRVARRRKAAARDTPCKKLRR